MPSIRRCDPALLRRDLSGKVNVVTGANSGVGLATTTQLVHQGAKVAAGCRRIEAGKQALAEISGEPGSFEVMELDLGSLASVKRFAGLILTKHDRLDGLINNAGIMHSPEGRTEDG